ncbi:MAG: phytoene/squalene synthase family protein [Verrucomicrobiia bacterium]
MDRALASAYEQARVVTRHHAKTFYFCSFGLPSAIRRHAYAVYACCRTIDDEIDRAPSPAAIPERVAGLRRFLDGLYHGEIGDPAPRWAAAFQETVRVCDIPQRFFSDLLDGVEMDRAPVRIETWPELERYCYHVAGVVGLMMTRVFGLRDRSKEAEAIKLGEAMQLTNILRDVAEDLRLDRIYLPASMLWIRTAAGLRFG